MTTPAQGYAAQSADSKLAPFSFERRDPQANDVAIDIRYCGVCHSDLHTARGEWPGTLYPCVPGHEIVGTVTAVGVVAGAQVPIGAELFTVEAAEAAGA